ncbi:P-loop containing nucleoside triphosphate hydrolase protein [Flammula alnicola]|nr:P-loop containing nucleoside triphosphate hydrolase protein [Flammula alnicola]
MDTINLTSLRLADSTKPSSPAKSRTSKSKKKQPQSTGSPNPENVGPSAPSNSAVELVAYSQQSRFHRETFDASSIDIDIKGVNVSVNNKELLVDAHLRLKPGVRYGMVGQNGVGKSVLMSVLGNNILVGLPQNVRILHIAQLEEVTVGRQRGHTARQALLVAESELATLQVQDAQTYITSTIAHDVMTEVFGAYEALDVEADEARAKAILKGLGFSDEDLTKEGKEIGWLSGGWRMRVMLGKALFMKPDILLLDEPTNHLDLPAIIWLQSYLTNETEDLTVVVVSHDRNFLDAVTDETIIFREKKLTYHPGNYDDWERNTEEQRKRKSRLKEQIVTSMQRNVQHAKSTGDDKRLGQVASRKKIVVDQGVKTTPIHLPPPEPFNFPGSSFLQLSEVSFRYDAKPSSPMIINKVSLDIGPYARIGFLEVKKHHRLRIGYFSQHTVDQLDLSLSALQQLSKYYPDVVISEGEARSHFGSCGISGDPVTRPIRTLSGGQRNRVALALVTFHHPHVLLLDEITNHLDMGTVESLVESLCEFEGALVVVSHDIWFLKQVIEGDDEDMDEDDGEQPKGVLYTVTKKGELKMWDKGLEAYVERIQRLSVSKGLQGRVVT